MKTFVKDDKLNMKASFYCGDAAGRPKVGDRKKDFSDSDRKFAINVGIPFKVPEEIFLDEKVRLPALQSAIAILEKSNVKSKEEAKAEEYKKEGQEIILFYGAPGSGKSTFWKNNLSDYERVNNDTLKTP